MTEIHQMQLDGARHRDLVAADEDFMWEIVYHAAHVSEDAGVEPRDIRSDPDLTPHVSDWGRPGDLGIVVEQDGVDVGAAWVRLMIGDQRELPYFVDDTTPELVISVLPGHEGNGLGNAMMTALLERAFGSYPAIMLTVRADSPAVRLYERHGFSEIQRLANRVGTMSIQMVLDFESR